MSAPTLTPAVRRLSDYAAREPSRARERLGGYPNLNRHYSRPECTVDEVHRQIAALPEPATVAQVLAIDPQWNEIIRCEKCREKVDAVMRVDLADGDWTTGRCAYLCLGCITQAFGDAPGGPKA